MKIQLTNAANYTQQVNVPTTDGSGAVRLIAYAIPPKSTSTTIEMVDGREPDLPPRVTMDVLDSPSPVVTSDEQTDTVQDDNVDAIHEPPVLEPEEDEDALDMAENGHIDFAEAEDPEDTSNASGLEVAEPS